MTLEEFLASPLRNVWLTEPDIAIYVRKAICAAHGQLALHVANVEVPPSRQKLGTFTAWLKKAEALNPYPVTYIENVLNPVLHGFLKRQGYTRVNGFSYSKSK